MDNTLRLVLSVILTITLMTILVLVIDNSLIISIGTAIIVFFSLWVFNRERWKKNSEA